MPVQEGVVFSKAGLRRPCGVLFDPPCKTRLEDEQAWAAMIPHLEAEIDKHRHIAVIVQCRNTRKWNDETHNYAFNPKEDYLIAAYSVSEEFGEPWVPGSLTEYWLNYVINRAEGRTIGLKAEALHMFQCSEKGCNLSVVGAMTLIKFFKENNNLPEIEAKIRVKNDMSNGAKYGWQGKFLGVYSDGPTY